MGKGFESRSGAERCSFSGSSGAVKNLKLLEAPIEAKRTDLRNKLKEMHYLKYYS